MSSDISLYLLYNCDNLKVGGRDWLQKLCHLPGE